MAPSAVRRTGTRVACARHAVDARRSPPMASHGVEAILSVLGVGAVSLVGTVTLAWDPGRLHRATDRLVAFAVGALLGDALLHLVPEALGADPSPLRVSVQVLAGMGTFFVLERLLRHRLHHLRPHHGVHPVVAMNLVGDGLHNLVDGMMIAGSWSTGDPVQGATTTLAVLLHEVPQEVGDFAVLVHGGLAVRRAIAWNAFSAAMAVLGAVAVLALEPCVAGLRTFLVPFTAGGFLYVAGSDLIPELQHRDVGLRASLLEILLVAAGVGVMAAFLLIE